MAGICGPVGNGGTGYLKQEVWEFYNKRDFINNNGRYILMT